MASIQAPIPPENLPSNEVIMEDMALYAERIDLEGMMQEYLRRVLLNTPEDPITYLITQISKNPFKARGYPLERDPRSEAEKAKHMDRNIATERAALLQQVFETVETEPGTELVSKAKLIVALKARPNILLERFPRHVHDILRCIGRMKTQDDVGMTLDEFHENAMRVLRAAGGLAKPREGACSREAKANLQSAVVARDNSESTDPP